MPAWHEARRELPFVFAASAAASAGAAVALSTPPRAAGPARRLAVGGAVAELTLFRAMQARLGPLATAYRSSGARRWNRAGFALTGGGALALAVAEVRGRGGPRGARRFAARRRAGHERGRAHALTVAGGALTLAGALATRFAVVRAGVASAEDPAHTIAPQRARLGG